MAPPLLALRDIRVAFADQVLIDGAGFALAPGDRLCLVGRNGAGKSTLLKIAGGLVDPDGGEVFLQPGTRVSYLSQSPDFGGAATILDYVMAGGAAAYEGEAVLSELGLDPAAATTNLSGGEARKVAIARVLADDPDILLLDEPTNHLDLPSIEWLEERLSQFRGAFVLISHDRAFLRRLTAGCLWVDRGTVRRLDKGFGMFEEWTEQILAEEEIVQHKLDRLIVAETQWSREGISARRKRNQGRLRRLYDLRSERAGQIAQTGRAALAVETGAASGTLVIEAKNLTKSYGPRTIISDFSTRIVRGDKVGLIGPNGVGKSTLLKMLMGQLAPDSGTLRLGTNITPVILDQSRATLDPEATLWDTLCEGGGDQVMVRGAPRHVVSYLRDFLFREAQARQPVKALSGGEQGRLILARALAKPSNLLVLDEPTNDLDMETLDLLQEMLTDYEGTVLLVSHDRDFLDRVVSSVIALDGTGATEEYPGGYSDWQTFIRNRNNTSAAAAKSAGGSAPKVERATKAVTKLSYKETRLLEELGTKMPKFQSDIAKLEKQLADPDLYTRDPNGFATITARHDALRADLEKAEEQWLELEMKREELSGS